MLAARELAVEVGGTSIVEGVSLTVRAGERVGLVGRNGAGKTSLLRVLGGAADPTLGVVRRTGSVGYLSQDPQRGAVRENLTALVHVLGGRGLDDAATRLEKLRVAMEESPDERAVARYSRAEEAFRHDGGYRGEAEVRRLLAGLGLEPSRADLSLVSLSGGERRRVELARILFAGSDVLLLDEPTNHLDADARTWLLDFLRRYSGALLVISHDLELLDDAITRVLHLDRPHEEGPGELVEYRGTYSQYRAARSADEARRAKRAAADAAEIRRLSALADSMRGQTQSRARVAKVLDHRVERMRASAIDAPARRRSLRRRVPVPPHCGRVVAEVAGLAKGYGATPVFDEVSFDLARGERLLVMGLNGAGKTSLLRILAGVTEADAGSVRFGSGVSVGYYAQEHEGIEPGRTLLDHLRGSAGVPDESLRSLLGMFGISGDKVFQDAGTLSGGEKTKLALAMLCAGRHNLLLLDEPTNNLDPGARRAAAEALAAWPGSMILVSHDRQFVHELGPDRVMVMPEGELDHWNEDHLELVELA